MPCTACIRHEVTCSLESASNKTSVHRTGSRSLPPAHVSPLLGTSTGTASPTDSYRNFQHTPSSAALDSIQLYLSAFDTNDCFVSISELMSHWTTKAYASMGAPENPDILQSHIPKVAFAHPYLLRGILAFSAFHLACINPVQPSRYRLMALRHQNLSLRGLQEVWQQATAEDCHALFLTALLLVVTKFASFRDCTCTHYRDYRCGAPIQNLIEASSVCAGVATIKILFRRRSCLRTFPVPVQHPKQG